MAKESLLVVLGDDDYLVRQKAKELFDHLCTQFPLDDYCSEEAAEVEQPIPLNSEFAWVLDPVDGTNNYAVGVPECGISLGLLQNGVPVPRRKIFTKS